MLTSILYLKLKVFADHKSNVAQMKGLVCERTENIMEKINTSSKMFSKYFRLRFFKTWNYVLKIASFLNPFPNKPWFLRFCSTRLLKTLGKGEIACSEQFAGDNFEFDENGRQFTRHLENTVGKGEIAHSEQFLLFPQCFLTVW